MDYLVSSIVWDNADKRLPMLCPTEMFVCWENGCNTKEAAIDFVADYYTGIILSCVVTEE